MDNEILYVGTYHERLAISVANPISSQNVYVPFSKRTSTLLVDEYESYYGSLPMISASGARISRLQMSRSPPLFRREHPCRHRIESAGFTLPCRRDNLHPNVNAHPAHRDTRTQYHTFAVTVVGVLPSPPKMIGRTSNRGTMPVRCISYATISTLTGSIPVRLSE